MKRAAPPIGSASVAPTAQAVTAVLRPTVGAEEGAVLLSRVAARPLSLTSLRPRRMPAWRVASRGSHPPL
jgi:hypothetical protein